jgi:hypothetical protein
MSQYSEGSYDIKHTVSELEGSLERIGSNFKNSTFGSYDNCPNPKSGISGGEVVGGTFSVDSGVHAALEGALETVIGNMEIEGGETEGGAKRSKESRALRSIGRTGNDLKSQLSYVSDSVTKRIENIYNLQNVIDSGFNKLYDIIKRNEHSINSQDAQIINDVQNALKNEMQNQLKALENILNVSIRPSAKSLIDLLKNNDSFSALADTLGVGYNDADASDRLALVYTNLSHLGLISKQVKDALSTLNITLEKYKNINNVEELKNILSETLKRINDTKTTEQLNKIIKAMGVLENSQHRHSEVVDCLKDEKKCSKPVHGGDESNGGDELFGAEESFGGDEFLGAEEAVGGDESIGGDYTKNIGRIERSRTKSTLVRRIKTYEKTLKELFKNFISQINLNFRDIQKDVQEVSDLLGNEIPYDDNIKLFINIFEGFIDDLENEKLFYALIGLDRSMASREVKIRFMDNLNRLIQSLEVLKNHKYLGDIKKQLTLTKENIDTYSDTVTNIKSSEEVKKGGNDFMWTDKLVAQSMPLNTAKIIRDTINKLKFYGSVSMIKANLSRMTKEHTEYKADYNQLLGKSIGIKLTELNREYTENIDRLHDKERGRGWVLDQYNNQAGLSQDDKIPRGLVETLYKLQYDSKVGLYKTIEAIDIYLIDFTEELSGNIEATRELSQMLKQTEIISKWFDAKSGTNLKNLLNLVTADVKQTISEVTATDLKVLPELSSSSVIKGKDIKEILENSKRAIDSVAVLKNIISMFVHIGDKFGNKSLSKEMYMSPNIIYKNLVKYIWVSAFTMGYGTGGGNINTNIDSIKKDKNVYEIEKGDKSSFFDIKFTSLNTPLDTLKDYEDKLRANIKTKKQELVDAVSANPIAAVGGLGQITNEAEIKAAVEASKLLPNANPDSIVAYRFVVNNALDAVVTAGTAGVAREANTVGAADILNTAKLAGVNGILAAAPVRELVVSRYYDLELLEKSIKNDIFTNEDKYFILSLKAITAKILTVIGSTNLLKQPSSVSSMITNPIRTIIGGGLNPEVNDDAFELYIRLPLLVEFYKNIFENGNEQYKKNKYKSDETEIIAYIPEVGSIWSGLIQCIFDESRYIANGIYSVENMKKIIFEVNNIFKSYKNVEKAKLVRTVILDLVSEINRRYGILKRQEINEFYQIKKKYTKNMDDINVNNVNFDILDDSNEYEDAGPSSQYTENIFNKTSNSSKIIQTDINIVKAFRDKIHTELFNKGVELKDLSKKSFTEKIKFYKNELKNLQSNEPKIELIIKAIDESSNINSHNTDVNLMFHELVISPLKNLQVLDNWMYSLFSSYIPEMYASYHKCQIDNRENIDALAAPAVAAAGDLNALKAAINSVVYNPNLVTKLILQGCDTLNGAVPTVASSIANAQNINNVVFILTNLVGRCDLAGNVNSYTNTRAAIVAAGIPATLAGLVPAAGIPVSAEYTAFVNSVTSKYNELLVAYTAPAAALTPEQELITYHKLRSAVYKFVGSFINNLPQLNDIIDVVNSSYETIKLARIAEDIAATAAAPAGAAAGFVNANRSLYQINQDIFLSCIDGPLRSGFNKVTLVNFVSELTFDGNNLLNMKFMSSNKFVLDYTKLQEYIEKSIESVKYMISKFRNQLPKNMITKYEECVFNIEDKLLFKILNNQDTTDVALFNVYNLDLVNNSFGEIINNTRQINVNSDLYNSIMFDGRMNLNATTPLSGLPAGVGGILDPNSLFSDVFKQYVPANRSWTRHDQLPAGAIDFQHTTSVYGNVNQAQTNAINNGLVYKFNTLVYQYLTVFYDSSTKKIYNNLFNEFATKSQSTCIFGNTGIADIFAGAVPGVPLLNQFVQNDFVLCESLAIMFKTFINRTTNVQLPIKYHLQTMLSEVSPNMLEKYKVFLPVFITLFESLIQKALLYKKILDTTEDSKIAGPNVAAIAILPAADQTINGDIAGENQVYKGKWIDDSQNSQIHYNNTLVNLIEGSRSLVNDATAVLAEMNAKPQYFELKENFIKNFYNNSNTLPLMPTSLNTIMLNNSLNEQSLLPNNVSPTFTNSNIKFLYGINSVINNKSLDNNINSYIWLKEAFAAYNSSALSVNKIDVSKINDYLDVNNKLSITLSKILHYNRFLSKNVDLRNIAVAPNVRNVLTNTPAVGSSKNEIINTYFTLPNKDVENAISITENSAIENSKMKISNETILNGLTKDSFNLNRSNARLLNIIDLNIIPINVHALMREIPLINVYNYAFTYDSVIKGEFGDVAKPSTKEEMLAKLLLDPYYISNEVLTLPELQKNNAPLAGVPALPLAGAPAKYVSTYDLIKQTITEPFKNLGTAKFLTDMANESLFVNGAPSQSVVNLRVDNKFTRNVMFLVNLQRVIMYKIKKEVERIDTKVVSDIGLLNPKITGYDNTPPAFDDNEFEYLEI